MFSKSIENPINKFDVKIITNRKNYLKWLFRLTFRRKKQRLRGLLNMEKDKCRKKFNKLTDFRAAMLELSKEYTTGYHYIYIKIEYEEKVELLFTDNYSLLELKLKMFMKIF